MMIDDYAVSAAEGPKRRPLESQALRDVRVLRPKDLLPYRRSPMARSTDPPGLPRITTPRSRRRDTLPADPTRI